MEFVPRTSEGDPRIYHTHRGQTSLYLVQTITIILSLNADAVRTQTEHLVNLSGWLTLTQTITTNPLADLCILKCSMYLINDLVICFCCANTPSVCPVYFYQMLILLRRKIRLQISVHTVNEDSALCCTFGGWGCCRGIWESHRKWVLQVENRIWLPKQHLVCGC